MLDESTILAQFLTQGDAEFIASMKSITTSMEAAVPIAQQLIDRIMKLADAQKISSKEAWELSSSANAVAKQLTTTENERRKILETLRAENDRYNATLSQQNAEMAKVAARTAELNATALGRFTTGLYGGAAGFDKFQNSAYQASAQAAAFSRAMATAPIQALQAFRVSTEKAAIATQFLKEQLAFIAASRFGTIMIGFMIFGTIEQIIQKTVEATAELDKAVHHVASAFLDAKDPALYYGQIQRQIQISSIETGKSFEEVGQVIWELKSAGLSAAETFAFIDTNMKLATLNNAKMNETVRLTVGLYRTFGDTVKGATTPMERMNYIADTLIYALNQSAADMPGIMQAFKYVASTADLAGISFEEVTASIIVLNNHMIQNSTAGMSMNQMLLHYASNWQKIGRIFDIAIDPSKPIQLANIMEQLNKNSRANAMSINQLAATFEAFEIRGGRAFATLIKNSKEWSESLKALQEGDQMGGLARLFEIQMDNLSDQFKRFQAGMKSAFQVGEAGAALKTILKSINDIAEATQRINLTLEKQKGEWTNYGLSIMRSLSSPVKMINAMALFSAALIGKAFKEGSKELDKWLSDLFQSHKELNDINVQGKELADIVEGRLSAEEKYAVELAKGNKSLQEQLEHTKELEKATLIELNKQIQIKDNDKERKKALDDYIIVVKHHQSLEKQIHTEQEKAGKEQEKIQKELETSLKKQNEEQLKNLEVANKINEAFIQAKEDLPLKEVELLAGKFNDALTELNQATIGTESWRKAIEKVMKAYFGIANTQEIIKKAYNEIISQTSKLQSIGATYIDALIGQGRVDQARQIAQEMEDTAKSSLWIAKTDKERIDANNNIITSLKERLKIDTTDQRIINELNDVYANSYTLQKNLVSEANNQYDQTKAAVSELELARTEFEKMLTSSQALSGYISTANLETGKMKVSFNDVDEVVKRINTELDTMADKITNMPKLEETCIGNTEDIIKNYSYRGGV